MKTIKFSITECYDKERQEEFYKMEYGETGDYETTCKAGLYSEIKSICKRNKAIAEITFCEDFRY